MAASSAASRTASNPYSATTIAAVSKSTVWLMVAITPFVISFLIRSIGLFSIFCARSRMTMLAGSSSLLPLLLISHLLLICGFPSSYPLPKGEDTPFPFGALARGLGMRGNPALLLKSPTRAACQRVAIRSHGFTCLALHDQHDHAAGSSQNFPIPCGLRQSILL